MIIAGAIVDTDAWIGENAIINTGSIIDHNAVIGRHVPIAPGVTIGGEWRVGQSV